MIQEAIFAALFLGQVLQPPAGPAALNSTQKVVLSASSSTNPTFCDPGSLKAEIGGASQVTGGASKLRRVGNVYEQGGAWRQTFGANARGNAYELALSMNTCDCADGFVTVSDEIQHAYQVCPWAEDQGVSQTLRTYKRWEFKQNLMNAILSKAPRNVVNVGAHIGYFALMAAAYGHQVTAFEPVPHHAMRIAAAAAKNGFTDRITIYQNAIGAEASVVNITVDPSNSGGSAVGGTNGKYKITGIDMLRLDDVGIAEPPLLLMVDSEGHEARVMYGAWQTISTHRPDFILMEVAGGAEHKPCNSMEMAQAIMALGYSVHNAEACDPSPAELGKCQLADLQAALAGHDHIDALFVRKASIISLSKL